MDSPYFFLPKKVRFCRKCTISNQRPSSIPEFKHKRNREGAHYINFDDNGVCEACLVHKEKSVIDWDDRERQLIELCDRFRKKDGSYDCLVPGSGGKDSAYTAHLLKYKYNMNLSLSHGLRFYILIMV